MSTKRKKTYIKQSFFSGYGITIPLEGDLGFKTVSFRTVFFYNCLKFEVGDSLSGLICQSSHASPCLCTVTNCTIILQERKITQGRFSPRKTSYNHATIIKTCKQRSNFKRCILKGNLHDLFCWQHAQPGGHAFLTATQLSQQN